ncbi:hypothetical protein GCM10027271_56430 [Saccharopolyspora gloriosae]|uniref:Excreted virulence factor EspC (Type VII ESX diderm) n=1 Tax=Saccharopolyspora gloriosae TaxID=455344 RepID=A0A840NBZ7_9PSEU|nr:hypothetical protein [Saccharopolyspora gloriosae]
MAYEVVSEDLRAHASHLDALTDRLGTALSAAQEVSMSDEAYGLLCSFLPPIVNPTEEEGVNALKAAREGVEVTAENIRTTAKEYDANDDDNAESFRKFENQHLPEGKSEQQFTRMNGANGGSAPQQFGSEQQFTPRNAPYGGVEPGQVSQQHEVLQSTDATYQQATPRNAPYGGAESGQVSQQHEVLQGVDATFQQATPTYQHATPQNAPHGRQAPDEA